MHSVYVQGIPTKNMPWTEAPQGFGKVVDLGAELKLGMPDWDGNLDGLCYGKSENTHNINHVIVYIIWAPIWYYYSIWYYDITIPSGKLTVSYGKIHHFS